MAEAEEYRDALTAARDHALEWTDSLPGRPVTPRAGIDEILSGLDDLPEGPTAAGEVIDELARIVEPGLAGHGSGRFYGFVIGGAQPAAIGADWLVAAWDQNSAMLPTTPGTCAVELVAARWLLEALDLPRDSSVGFVTGAQMANFTGIVVGRDALLRRAGWDIAKGLTGGPRIRVLAGAELHSTAVQALRYAGLPEAELLDVDRAGTVRPEALSAALAAQPEVPTLLLLQAGNIHSGASDPFADLIPLAHEHGAWVHVDGAFGLWKAASPSLRPLVDGVELADSWATDAHKTLNVPYDSGVIVVRDAGAHRAAMSVHAPYLADFGAEEAAPFEYVPELSRRARGVPVWAALRAMGRSGVVDLVDRLHAHAVALADGIGAIPGVEILNDVVFTQVAIGFDSDARARAVADAVLAEGDVWMSGSQWHDRDILRASVSNWRTGPEDVERGIAAVRRAVEATAD